MLNWFSSCMILNRCGVLFFFESKIMGNGELTFKFWGVNLETASTVSRMSWKRSNYSDIGGCILYEFGVNSPTRNVFSSQQDLEKKGRMKNFISSQNGLVKDDDSDVSCVHIRIKVKHVHICDAKSGFIKGCYCMTNFFPLFMCFYLDFRGTIRGYTTLCSCSRTPVHFMSVLIKVYCSSTRSLSGRCVVFGSICHSSLRFVSGLHHPCFNPKSFAVISQKISFLWKTIIFFCGNWKKSNRKNVPPKSFAHFLLP